LHELGHSLLRSWGLPGWDQEDIADDFAVYLLLQQDNGETMAKAFGEFFVSMDAMKPYLAGPLRGRHSSGQQRYDKIQVRLSEPARFMEEWNLLLYPHTTTALLQGIVRAPRR
jgi:hypothetical protein